MKSYLFILIIFISLFYQHNSCHYSCKNCTSAEGYTSCFSCSDSSNKLVVLQNPDIMDPLYRHSIYKSGACTAIVPKGANSLGILLLILSIGGILLTQSFQALFIISTMQTLALFGLLEVAWIGSSGFILQAFQYFMPINYILSSSKTDQQNLMIYGFYRLDQYMVSTQDIGLIAIFGIDCVLFAAIIALFILIRFKKRRQKQQKQANLTLDDKINNQQHQLIPQISGKSDKQIKGLITSNKTPQTKTKTKKHKTSKIRNTSKNNKNQKPSKCAYLKNFLYVQLGQCLMLRKIMHVIIYLFFFFTQQTALSIMVGAVFSISKLDVAIWILYFIQIVTILIISYFQYDEDRQIYLEEKNKLLNLSLEEKNQVSAIDAQEFGLSLFLSRQSMFFLIMKKVILPLGVVLPIEIQYLYFIFYLILFLLESGFDTQSGRLPCISRLTLWKISEMLITTLILSFFFNERGGSQAGGASTINIVLTVLLIAFLIGFLCELVLSFISLFFKVNKIGNQNEVKNEKDIKFRLQNTQQTLNQIENPYNHHNVFDIIDLEQEDRKMQEEISPQKKQKVNIVNMQDVQNDHMQTTGRYKNKDLLIISTTKKPQPIAEPAQPHVKKVSYKFSEANLNKNLPPAQNKKAQINTIQPGLITKQKQKDRKEQNNNSIKTLDTNNNEEKEIKKKDAKNTKKPQQPIIQVKQNQAPPPKQIPKQDVQQHQQFHEQQHDDNSNEDEDDHKNNNNNNNPQQQGNPNTNTNSNKQNKKRRNLDPELRKRYGLK